MLSGRYVLVTLGSFLAGCSIYASDDPAGGKSRTPNEPAAVEQPAAVVETKTGPTTPATGTTSCSSGSSKQVIRFGETYAALCPAPDDGTNTYLFTVPQDAAGGVVEFALDVKGDRLSLEVQSTKDKGTLVKAYNSESDQPLNAWLTVVPGATYLMIIDRGSDDDASSAYDMKLTYTPFQDAYEPNNDVLTAKPIAKDTDIVGSGPIGLDDRKNAQSNEGDDWFSVDLAEGNVTVSLDTTTTTRTYSLYLYEPDGSYFDSTTSTELGMHTAMTKTIKQAGNYKVVVRYTSTSVLKGDDVNTPPELKLPYKLRVTQP